MRLRIQGSGFEDAAGFAFRVLLRFKDDKFTA